MGKKGKRETYYRGYCSGSSGSGSTCGRREEGIIIHMMWPWNIKNTVVMGF